MAFPLLQSYSLVKSFVCIAAIDVTDTEMNDWDYDYSYGELEAGRGLFMSAPGPSALVSELWSQTPTPRLWVA